MQLTFPQCILLSALVQHFLWIFYLEGGRTSKLLNQLQELQVPIIFRSSSATKNHDDHSSLKLLETYIISVWFSDRYLIFKNNFSRSWSYHTSFKNLYQLFAYDTCMFDVPQCNTKLASQSISRHLIFSTNSCHKH